MLRNSTSIHKIHACCYIRNTCSSISSLYQTQFHHSCIPPARVRTDIQVLFSRTFHGLQRPNSRVFQESKILFSRTFQETFHSKHWLHEVKKCIYKISYQCICIKVKSGNAIPEVVLLYSNEPRLGQQVQQLDPDLLATCCRSAALEFQDFRGISMVFQDLRLFPGLSGPGILINKIPGPSRVCTNPDQRA